MTLFAQANVDFNRPRLHFFKFAHHTYAVELADPKISAKAASLRFWYGASTAEFLDANSEAILGQLAFNCNFALIPTQRDAWLAQIEFLHSQLKGLSGSIFFELTFREWDGASMSFS